ncbi:MAG TPA: class I SAM-dependent methyltransferase [Bacillota bacterium]|nr:SAM-dependent methyltransferase [Fastidiosipila sp.]HPX93007.1 class I SAM-dependent methyltransferase [Bacillota bacterium]HQB80821.1 class I SAM-dependent methyltransferase [Bacillota bacterium]
MILDRTCRLGLLADLVRQVPCRRLVDIGCDHAAVPLALLKEGCCESVLVTDVREVPLRAAEKKAGEEGLRAGFQAKLAKGLEGLELNREDILLISGLGGDTIAAILEDHPDKLHLPKRIIIQPQTREETVRSAFFRTGLAITDEQCVEDRGRIYLVILSDRETPGHSRMSELEIYFGPVILSRLAKLVNDPLLNRYLKKRIDRLKKQAPYNSQSAELLETFEQIFHLSYNRWDQG